MNASLHTKALIWFGNCHHKRKATRENQCVPRIAGQGCIWKSHVRKPRADGRELLSKMGLFITHSVGPALGVPVDSSGLCSHMGLSRIYQPGQACADNSLKLTEISWVSPSAKLPKRFLLSAANSPGQGSPDSAANKAARRTWQDRSLHWACSHTSTRVTMLQCSGVQRHTAPKHPFPSAAIPKHHPNQPRAPEVTWPKHYYC